MIKQHSEIRKRQGRRKGIDFKALREARMQGGWGYHPKQKGDRVADLTYKIALADHQIKYTYGGSPSFNHKYEIGLDILAQVGRDLEVIKLDKYQKQKFASSVQARAYRISNSSHVAKNPKLDTLAIKIIESMEEQFDVIPHPALEETVRRDR